MREIEAWVGKVKEKRAEIEKAVGRSVPARICKGKRKGGDG